MYILLHDLCSFVKIKMAAFFLSFNLPVRFSLSIAFIMLAQTIMANSGDLDQTFGNGGLIITPGKSNRAVAKQPDGKFLVGGTFTNSMGNIEFSIIRYNPDGSIDNSFGNGEVHTDFNSGVNYITSIAVASNGKIVVAGYHAAQPLTYSGVLIIARYNPDGSLDNSFNGNGRFISDLAGFVNDYKIAIQSDEKIAVISIKELIRINANGTLDQSFGEAGKITYPTSFVNMTSVAVQNDGKIVAAGSHISFKGVIYRYNTDGTTDSTFGKNGEVMTNYGGGYLNSIRNIIIQNDGKILVAGTSLTSSNTSSPYVLGLARFNADGSLDTGFDGDGTVTTNFGIESGIGNSANYSLNLDTNGKIVVAGGSNDYQIARFNTNGSLDNSFSDDGIVAINFGKNNQSTGAVISGSNVYIAGNSSTVGATLAAFSLDNKILSGLSYRYYTGDWNMLPDFSALTPVKTGFTANVDISIRPQGTNDHFAFIWEGYINIQTPGNYTFETVSDDGSKFYFNSFYAPSATALINNDGLHAAQSETGSVNIPAPGLYPVAITYFEKDGGEAMQLYWTAPGMARQLIPNDVLTPRVSDADIVSPTAPGNLHVVYQGRRFVRLDWENSTDNKGVTGYQVYNNGVLVLTTSQSVATIENLTANTEYRFNVRAVDSTGNISDYSNPGATVTTRTSGLNYKFYTNVTYGSVSLDGISAAQTGVTNNIDISKRPQGVNSNYAYVWEGYINIPAPGTYTFETISDDGSRFYFNSFYSTAAESFINNYDYNGLHAPISVSRTINIPSAGLYPIAALYHQYEGDQTMQLYWQGPGIPRQLIPDAAFIEDARPGILTNGLNYKYYEGSWTTLPDFTTITPVQMGQTATIDISKRPAGKNDNFAFVWEGYINIPSPGTYTFETVSDDGSKLYFNSKYVPTAIATVNNDGLHPAISAKATVSIAIAGTYPISITFFENTGDEKMELYWSGPFITRQLIPAEAFSPNPSTFLNRLNYDTHLGNWSVLPDFRSIPEYRVGARSNVDISIKPAEVDDNFGTVWRGYINIPAPGTYTFETVSDDGSKIYFNSNYEFYAQALVDNDGVHPAKSATGSITIANAGVYPIAFAYFEQNGGQSIEVYWTGPGIPRQRIPDEAFALVNASTVLPYTYNRIGNLNSEVVNAAVASQQTINLRGVYPNPFDESVTIDFYNAVSTNDISIGLFDLNGRKVLTNHPGRLPAGNNSIKMNLNGINIKDGVYIIQIQKNGIAWKTMKVVKMKK
jgi:uncharacterized delta-60 repeat protein